MSYPGLSWEESYPSAEMQTVYSTAPVFIKTLDEAACILQGTNTLEKSMNPTILSTAMTR